MRNEFYQGKCEESIGFGLIPEYGYGNGQDYLKFGINLTEYGIGFAVGKGDNSCTGIGSI